MNLISAFILGVVEGITEFLPISSTAHLIIVSSFLNLSQTEFLKFFEVVIQSGAIMAVIFMYFQYLNKNKNLIRPIFFSFIPTAVIGFLFYKIIKNVFFASTTLIVGTMISFGVLFLVVEYLVKTKKFTINKKIKSLSLFEAIFIGINQAISVIPGVSRSGIVMITMMGMGYKRDESATYSFLLAVPTIIAASILDLYKSRQLFLDSTQYLPSLFVGFIISFITAYVSIKWLVKYLQKSTLTLFGIYRIILGIILFFIIRQGGE